MSSYFDAADREVNEVAHRYHHSEDTNGFLEEVVAIENRVVRQVNMLCGDREFPDDLREKIMQAIAVWQIRPDNNLVPSERAKDYCEIVRSSRLLHELHSLFHDLADRQIETRWGLLFDDPAAELTRRYEHDEESYG